MNERPRAAGDPGGLDLEDRELEAIGEEVSLGTEDGVAAALLMALVEQAEAERAEPRPGRIEGVVVGRLVALTDAGPIVLHRHSASVEGDPARAMAALTGADVGHEVALLFEGGSPDRPVVMGAMHRSAGAPEPEIPARVEGVEGDEAAPVERLVLRAGREIVLQCGDASITLTRAGKILIRGAYVLSRASSVNRIQGGSVEIN